MTAGNNTIISLEGLSKRYGYGDAETYALHDFSLEVKQGEFIMIMGPSGCGKTSLLNILGLLDRPTSGVYKLAGKPVGRISDRKKAKIRARTIGFIFQNFNLISSLPIIENVSLPLVYAGFTKTHRLKMADSILDRFHLREREYYLPWQLSGGQQQRAAIARSLVASPEIILADEPTGNLDSRSAHIVMEELREIHSEGNTIIMVTHNPALTSYATRVIHMLDGQIDTDIKTVADRDLPLPVAVHFVRKHKKPSIEFPWQFFTTLLVSRQPQLPTAVDQSLSDTPTPVKAPEAPKSSSKPSLTLPSSAKAPKSSQPKTNPSTPKSTAKSTPKTKKSPSTTKKEKAAATKKSKQGATT